MNRVDDINRGVADAKPLESVEIQSVKGKVSDEEWAIRVDLAAAYRMVAYYGWDDLIFTHLSARIPGPEHHFLLNPYNLMFEEVTASSLVKVDVDGNPVDPTPFITNPVLPVIEPVRKAQQNRQRVNRINPREPCDPEIAAAAAQFSLRVEITVRQYKSRKNEESIHRDIAEAGDGGDPARRALHRFAGQMEQQDQDCQREAQPCECRHHLSHGRRWNSFRRH